LTLNKARLRQRAAEAEGCQGRGLPRQRAAEAEGRRGKAETRTGRKMPRGKSIASRTTSLAICAARKAIYHKQYKKHIIIIHTLLQTYCNILPIE